MEFDKTFLYDWNGGNELLFRKINSLEGDLYDALMLLLSRIADYHNFPYYMGALLLYVLAVFAVRKLGRRGGARQWLISWLGVTLVLVAGYAAEGGVVKALKSYFHYPRPYAELMVGDVRQLEQRDATDSYQSFPSGHAAFITVMVAGLWPMLSAGFSLAGVALIFGVCWSRVALGVHFPADVVAGFLIGLFVIGFLRPFIYWLLHRLFGFNFPK